jgi:hypothetical protein
MNSDLERWGIDRRTKSRAVAALESAGLISVERKTHRWPIVTILDCPKSPSGKRGHHKDALVAGLAAITGRAL